MVGGDRHDITTFMALEHDIKPIDGAELWNSPDLSPLTRVVIAAFSSQFPEHPMVDVDRQDINILAQQAFPRRAALYANIGRLPLTVVRGNIMKDIQKEVAPEAIRTLCEELGELSGGTPGTKALARQIESDVRVGSRLTAIGAPLQVLSELAIIHRARK